VVIIDEFTGRMMPAGAIRRGCTRRWRRGAQPIQAENQTLGLDHLPDYFRMYEKLARHDRTALTKPTSSSTIYNLEVLEVPTNQLMVRIDDDDEVYRTAAESTADSWP